MVLLLKQIVFDKKDEVLGQWSEHLLAHRPYDTRVPVLVHDEHVIIESAIIMEYLEDFKPGHAPCAPDMKAAMRLWTHWSASELRDAIQEYKYGETDESRAGAQKVQACFEKLEQELLEKQFLMGDTITLADCAVWPFVRQALRVEPSQVSLEPATERWFAAIEGHELLVDLMKK